MIVQQTFTVRGNDVTIDNTNVISLFNLFSQLAKQLPTHACNRR